MPPPVCHVVHLLYHFGTGGLENVVVQLINQLPWGEFRHTVIAITDADPAFVKRIERTDVDIIGLQKPPGQPYRLFPRVFRLLRRLKPDVLHSCNVAALEFVPVAALAGVPLRIHAEHGWDMGELGAKATHYRRLRQFYKHFVHDFIAVSTPLHDYLQNDIGIASRRLHLIPNGVDTAVFRPATTIDAKPEGFPFTRGQHWVIGMVGRMVPIKNPLMLVDAFISLIQSNAPGTQNMRLAMVGDGPLMGDISQRMHSAGLADHLWLPGGRGDIAAVLRATQCFVLPSLSEGTSCTLQEAMATGLPIVATQVGGNADLLEGGRCGTLVPSGDAAALANAIMRHYAEDQRSTQARAAQQSVQQRYGLPVIISRYRHLFMKHTS